MLKELFINFSVLTMFVIFGSWFLRRFRAAGTVIRTLCIGLFSGGTAVVLMYFSVHITSTTIMDARQIVLMTATLFGGLPAALLSATVMAVYRLLHYGVNASSVTAVVNLAVMAFGTAWIARKVGSFYLKWTLMLLFTVLIISASFLYLLKSGVMSVLPYYIPFVILSGMYAMLIIDYQAKANEKHQLHLALERMIGAFTKAKDSKQIYRIALANLIDLFEVQFGSIQLIRHGKTVLVGRFENGVFLEESEADGGVEPKEAFAEALSGRTLVYADWSRRRPADPDKKYYFGEAVRSSIHAPLFHEGKAAALISLGSTDPGFFGDKQKRIFDYLHPFVSMVTAQKEAEEKFRTVVEVSVDAIVIGDEQAAITYWSSGAERMFGASAREMIGRQMTELVPVRYRSESHLPFARYLDNERIPGRTIELTGLRGDGSEFPIELSLNRWENAGATHLAAIVRDITERKQTVRALQMSEERYRRFIELSPDAIVIVVDRTLVFANKQAVRLIGAEGASQLEGCDIYSFVDASAANRTADLLASLMKDNSSVENVESRYIRLDGTAIDVELSAAAIPFDEATGIMVVIRDITERKLAERRLMKANKTLASLASKDGLTGIANRRHFDERLAAEWGRSARDSSPLSLILCDIDYFKAYNDTYGHPGGDECLKLAARTIEMITKRTADLTARYGGEEFAVLLPNTGREGAALVAERIRRSIESLRLPHSGSKAGACVTVSVGIATMSPSAAVEPGVLIETADKALYRAKLEGRNRVAEAAASIGNS